MMLATLNPFALSTAWCKVCGSRGTFQLAGTWPQNLPEANDDVLDEVLATYRVVVDLVLNADKIHIVRDGMASCR